MLPPRAFSNFGRPAQQPDTRASICMAMIRHRAIADLSSKGPSITAGSGMHATDAGPCLVAHLMLTRVADLIRSLS
jgi:hypothetical protein